VARYYAIKIQMTLELSDNSRLDDANISVEVTQTLVDYAESLGGCIGGGCEVMQVTEEGEVIRPGFDEDAAHEQLGRDRREGKL
jgi:hypothetical protein